MPWWPRFSGGGDGAAGSGSDSNGGATKWRFAESGARGGRQLPPIPPELPLLPLQNAVLLPLGFLRVRVLASPLSDEASLARHLHRVLHQGFADPASDATAAAAVTVDRRPRPIIAAVPVVNTLVAVQISGDGAIVQPPTGSWTSGLSTASQKIEDVRNGEASEDEIAEPSGQNSTHHLFPLGSAAVVLQVRERSACENAPLSVVLRPRDCLGNQRTDCFTTLCAPVVQLMLSLLISSLMPGQKSEN